MQILRAAEDYLEAMLMMQQKHGYIRSIDIAEHLGVTKPSVTYTTKRLRENGYITMDRDGLITLTPSGMDIAARMLDRHHTLTKFLMELGVDAKTAEEDACIDWLREQVKIVRPKMVVCLGRISAMQLIKPDFRITKEHGVWFERGGYEMCALYHPSALLRDPRKKEDMLTDMKALKEKYDLVRGK